MHANNTIQVTEGTWRVISTVARVISRPRSSSMPSVAPAAGDCGVLPRGSTGCGWLCGCSTPRGDGIRCAAYARGRQGSSVQRLASTSDDQPSDLTCMNDCCCCWA